MRLLAASSSLLLLLALALPAPAPAAPYGSMSAAVPFEKVEPESVGMSSQHLQKASSAVKDLVAQRESFSWWPVSVFVFVVGLKGPGVWGCGLWGVRCEV